METDTVTIDDAKVLLATTDLTWNQSNENQGWFYVILSPTTVTKVWYEDVPEFVNSHTA